MYPVNTLFALIDCNNFFVSCERTVDPSLEGKPVVVLSNNNGCIVSRSKEAKALGIPMGAPFFKWEHFMRVHNVVVISSHFSLYGELSRQVMKVIARFAYAIEVYSVDEAFLSLEGIKDPVEYCRAIREAVSQETKIPVSIGIGATKTLAKVAGDIAKKDGAELGVSAILDAAKADQILHTLPTKEVWGIGSKTASALARKGVYTAKQLKDAQDLWIQKYFSATLLQVALELRGIVCFSLNEQRTLKKSIAHTRSFSPPIFEKTVLQQHLAHFASQAAEDLREEGLKAQKLFVFIMTNRFGKAEDFYFNEAEILFPQASDYTPHFVDAVTQELEKMFRVGDGYKRAGVILSDFVADTQLDLFLAQNHKKQEKLVQLMDQANAKYGYSILRFANN